MNLLWSLIVIIFGMGHVSSSFSYSSHQKANEFSLLSYNVNCFNPRHRKGPKDKLVFKKITDDVIAESPTVLCFQEYCSYPTIDNFNTQKKLRSYDYNYLMYKNRWPNSSFSTAGLAIFSKLPIIDKGEVVKDGRETVAIYADIIFRKDTLRIYNSHLFSMGLVDPNDKDGPIQTTSKLYKLQHGFKQKAIEADLLYDAVKKSPFPAIIAGDFNEIPFSYVYQKFKRKFNNSFEIAGNGFGFTYNGDIPMLRIDNQFSDRQFRVISHRVLTALNMTDHFPILVNYELD